MAAKGDYSLWINLELFIVCEKKPILEEASAVIAKDLKDNLFLLSDQLKKTKELKCVCIKDVQHNNGNILLTFHLNSKKQLKQLYKCLKSKDNQLSKHLSTYIHEQSLELAAGLERDAKLSCHICMSEKQFRSFQADLCTEEDSLTEDASSTKHSSVAGHENLHSEGNVRRRVDQLNQNSVKEEQPGSYPRSKSEQSESVTNTNISSEVKRLSLTSSNKHVWTENIPTIKKKFVLFFPPKKNLLVTSVSISSIWNSSLKSKMYRQVKNENMYELCIDVPINQLDNRFTYVCRAYDTSFVSAVTNLFSDKEVEFSSGDYVLYDDVVQRHVWRGKNEYLRDIFKFSENWMYEHLRDIIFNEAEVTTPFECCIQVEAVVKTVLPLANASSLIKRLAHDLRYHPAISSVLFIVILGKVFNHVSAISKDGPISHETAKQIISKLSSSPVVVNELPTTSKKNVHGTCKFLFDVGFGDSTSDIQVLDTCFYFYGVEYILSKIQDGNVLIPFDTNEQSLTALSSVMEKLFNNGSSCAQQIAESIFRRLPFDVMVDTFTTMYTPESDCDMHTCLYGSMTIAVDKEMAELRKNSGTAFSKLQKLVAVLLKHDEIFLKFRGKIENSIILIIESSSSDQYIGDCDICVSLMTKFGLFSSSESIQRLLNCIKSSKNMHILLIFKELFTHCQNTELLECLGVEKFELFCDSYIAACRSKDTHDSHLQVQIKALCDIWELPVVKQNTNLQHVVRNISLKLVQGLSFRNLFGSIDEIDRVTSHADPIVEAIVSHVNELLKNNKETPENILTTMSQALEAPSLRTRLSADVVNVILNVSGSLPDDISDVKRFNHLVSNFQFWTLMFSCTGEFKPTINQHFNYVRAKSCIVEVFDLFKRHEICYSFLKEMNFRQTDEAKKLLKYWRNSNEVEKIWSELEFKFKELEKKCDCVANVVNIITKSEPRFVKEFTEFSISLKAYINDLKTGKLTARGCFENPFWRDMEELVTFCEGLSDHVQSIVFWNISRDVVFEEVKEQEDPLWSIRGLYENTFLIDHNITSHFLCHSYASHLFKTGCTLYHEKWSKLTGKDEFTMKAIKSMFGSNPDVEQEVKIAKFILHKHIGEDVVNALRRIFSIHSIAKTVQNIECLFGMFGIDSSMDEKCQDALTAFHQLLDGTAENSTFIEVKQSLETVFTLVGILKGRSVDILNVLVKATTLLEFLKDIVDEDIKNLIDAVEDISEQQVQASTVSALIEVKQFLQPMLVLKDDWTCADILKIIDKQTLFFGEKAGLLPPKIDDCVQNVHNLRSLYNGLANRSEQTKEIVSKILFSGEYYFCMSANYNSVEFEVVLSKDDTRKQSTLIDLRSRALLLMNTFKKETCEEHEDGVKLESFVRDVDLCLEIIEIMFNLHTAGHINFMTIKEKIKAKCLGEKKDSLQDILDKWQTILDDVRHTHYLMNFIDGNQLHILYRFLEDRENVKEEVQLIMAFLHPDLNAFTVKDIYEHEISTVLDVDNKCMLLNIGHAIHCAYGGLKICQRTLNIDRNRISDLVQQGKLTVVQLEEGSLHTVKTMLSLYINTTRCLPEPSQILFCRRDTAWTELDLIVRRCIGAGKFYGMKTLFCIAHVENLPGELQFRLVEKLHQLQRDSKFLLAVICRGSRNHPFVDELSDCLSAVKPATDSTVEEIFSTHCPEVSTLTSTRAGQGKSTFVRTVAQKSQMGHKRFHISGQVGKSELVERLNSLKMKEHHLLHIDVGTVDDPSELDTFLFELVVLKYVSAGRKAVKLVSEHVFIELANSIGDTLRKSLHTTVLFRREIISPSGHVKFVASKDVNSPIQIVCFYLKHLDKGTLDNIDLTQDSINWKPLSGSRCRSLLSKYVFKDGDKSFPAMHVVINVLADQLKKMSQSSFFKASRLREMVGNKSPVSITSKLVKAMIDVATEFATRSVESCRDTQSTTIIRDIEEQSQAKAEYSTKIANLTDGMIRWEDSNHMIFVFHNQNINTLSALYRHLSKVPVDIRLLFESQMKKEMVDFNVLKQIDFQDLLQKIARVNPFPLSKERLADMSLNYALTADNLLKMVLIMLRIKANIPVLVMGETGCGKTSLIRYLASVCEVNFEVFNIHAGIPEDVVVENILKNNVEAMENIEEERWLFLDEINTSDSIGLISDAICHHSCLGRELSPNLIVMGACNPYKLRTSKDISTAGLEGKVKTDELSRLVYRVLPLPEIMVDYVWDFGSLNEKDEKMYIHRMIQDVFPKDSKNHNIFTDLLSVSQNFVRDHEQSQYSVSLRDVQRCRILAKWFLKVLPMKRNIETSTRIDIKLKAMILSLALSYHARFPSKLVRKEYRDNIGDLFTTNGMKFDDDQGSFIRRIIKEEQADILRRMKLPTGIAHNTALQENVFVILVCIFNQIPIFVVGKPGCSKSLAMQLIRSNLRGKDSEDAFFKTLPQLYCVSFQGSESSTSDGIIKVFKKAESYQDANKSGDVLSVVVLDEIGLAEISRFNPLKVLHSLLEPDGQSQPNVAVVGISNWALDASKMNRAVHLSRPDMDVEELYDTAKSISESFLESETKSKHLSFFKDAEVGICQPSNEFNVILEELATAYFQYIQHLRFKHFHGLRDYYSLVKYVAKAYTDGDNEFIKSKIADIIMHGIARNFGGLPEEIHTLYDVFRAHISLLSAYYPHQSPLLELVIENITDPIARHLMLITTGESVLGVLEHKLNELGSRQKEIIFGSHFEEDLTDDYNYRILSRIILCMEQGMILILKDLDNIYGSLYDMLNQNYTIIGKKKNCRVALGPYSNPICHVADHFRCIVLVDESMLDLSDPPFLNRFEKQYLRFSDIIQEKHIKFIDILEKWIGTLTKEDETVLQMNALFPICNKDLLASIVLKIEPDAHEVGKEHNIIDECQTHLLRIMKPDAVVRLQRSSSLAGSDVERLVRQYFELPLHDGFEYLMIHQLHTSPEYVLNSGILSVVFTNSNIHTKVICHKSEIRMQIEKIGAFKSEKQLSTRIQMFWDDSNKNHLIIQCNAKDEGHHILLTKLVVERCRKEYLRKANVEHKHVYLIIHIDQNNSLHAGLSQLNFLSDWNMFMLDCLDCPRITLPKLCHMSILEVINERRPLKGDLKEELLWAFSRIRYEQFGRRIESISNAIVRIEGSDDLMDVFENEIIDFVHRQQEFQRNKYWAFEVASNITSLKSSSGFIDALERHIKDTIKLPFAKLIFQIESMSLLESFFVADNEELQPDMIKEKRCKWMYCLRNKCALPLKDIVDDSGPECYTCSSHDLQLQMPCSQTIFDAIETTRNEFMELVAEYRFHCQLQEDDELPPEVYNEVLSQHEIVIVNKIPDLNELTYANWSSDYIEDFCSLTLDAVLVSKFKLRCKPFLFRILNRHDINCKGDPFAFVIRLHTIVWAHFDSIRAELLLLDTFLSKMPESSLELFQKMSEDVIENDAMKDSDACSTDSQDIENQSVFDCDEELGTKKYVGLFDGDTFTLSEFFDICSEKLNNNSQSQDFSDVSITSSDSEYDDYTSMSVNDRLVHFVCKQLLPSKLCLSRHKGVANWTLLVNEVLPLAAQVSREPPALYSLKVSSEIAENLITYFSLNEELLTHIGQSLRNHQLDSDIVYNALIRIIDKITCDETELSEQKLLVCYQTLSSYLVRCLSANPNTIVFSTFFEYVVEDRISSQYFRLFKVPFKTVLQNIDSHMFVKLFSDENFLNESIIDDESDKADKNLLKNVDQMIKCLLEKKQLESPVLTLLVDVLEEIFNETVFSNVLAEDDAHSESVESSVSNEFDEQDLIKILYDCQKSLTNHKPGLNYLASIAYCKCFTYYSTKVLENGNDDQVTKMMNVLSIVHNDLLKDGLHSLTCFQFKVLLERRTVLQTQKYCVSNSESMTFFNAEVFDFGTRNLHNSALCTHVDINEHKNMCFHCQETADIDEFSKLANISTETVSGMTQMFALIVRDFYLSKTINEHDDSKRTLAGLILNKIIDEGHKTEVIKFVKCLIGRENFHISDFGIDHTSSLREICVFSSIVTLIALVLANDKHASCPHKRRSFLTNVLLEPGSLDKSSAPGFCNQDLTRAITETVYTGICDCRNKVFVHENVESVECKICGLKINLTQYEHPSIVKGLSLNKGILADGTKTLSDCLLQFIVKSCILGSVAFGNADIDTINASLDFRWSKTTDALLEEVIEDWDTVRRLVNTNHNDTAILMNAVLFEAGDMLFKTCEGCFLSESISNFEQSFANIVENVFGEKTDAIRKLYLKDNELHHQHGSKRDFCDQVFELTDLNTISPDDRVTKLPQLYRLTANPTQENFTFELTRRKHQFPFLVAVLQHQKMLSLPTHIISILLWHSTTVAYASYMIKKQECIQMTALEFMYFKQDNVKSDIAKSRFEAFKTSWEFIRKTLKGTDIAQRMPIIHNQSKMEHCLILDKQSVIFKVLVTLINLQNSFLDNVGGIGTASMTLQSMLKEQTAYIPCVPLLEVKKDDLLDTQLDLDSILQEESQSDLRYGHGIKVHYDFYRIEEYLAKEVVLGKKYITSFDKLPNIIFMDELHLNYSSLVKEIKNNVNQVPLTTDISNGIMRQKDEDRRMPSELLTHLGIVMTIIKGFKANPEQPLVEFVDSWKSLMCRKFPKELLPKPESNIQLCHIVALSEVLEELCADNIRDGLSDMYRDTLDAPLRDHLIKLLKDEELSSLLFKALKRFIYRCLASTTADSLQSLRHYISDESFWPNDKFQNGTVRTTNKEYLILDILPDGLMVRHVADIVSVIEKENETPVYINGTQKRSKVNNKLSGFASSFQKITVSPSNKRLVQKKKNTTKTRKF